MYLRYAYESDFFSVTFAIITGFKMFFMKCIYMKQIKIIIYQKCLHSLQSPRNSFWYIFYRNTFKMSM